MSPSQLRKIGEQHQKLDDELEVAERAAMDSMRKVERLRKQKKMWFDKMMRAVRRGIDSVEELERVEREEADREASRSLDGRPPSVGQFSAIPDGEWDTVFPGVLSPFQLAQLGIFDGSPSAPSASS